MSRCLEGAYSEGKAKKKETPLSPAIVANGEDAVDNNEEGVMQQMFVMTFVSLRVLSIHNELVNDYGHGDSGGPNPT